MGSTLTSRAVVAKAERLHRTGAVVAVAGTAGSMYAVRGDTGIYLVGLLPDVPDGELAGLPLGVCSCPSPEVCSHIGAAWRYRLARTNADLDPFDGLDDV